MNNTMSRNPSLVAFALVIFALMAVSASHAETLSITKGGTYTGEYESIAVLTSEPVVIENATLRGGQHLITSSYKRADVTIRNCRGFGVNPNVAGKATGRFAHLEGARNVLIENCYLDGTAGIYVLDFRVTPDTSSNTVKILRNRARNIDGRKSDGNGGYESGAQHAAELRQFVQLDKCRNVAGVEIAWNEVVNEPGKSRAEDVISIYLSSGTKDSPIKIHDNFIRGAYPLDPTTEKYAGGGIMMGDGVSKEGPAGDPGFVEAFENQVLDTVNYGIAISSGHDSAMYRNRIVSGGLLADGRQIAAQNTGAYIWDAKRAGPSRFYNNRGWANLIGWKNPEGIRNDWWRPDATAWDDNEHWPKPVNAAVYDLEQRRWDSKVKQAAVTIGPTSP